jgi:hypothetical protein
MDHLLHLSATDGGNLIFIVCGNPRVAETAGTNTGKFAGISRRFILQRYIEGIAQEDADAIATAFGVEGVDALRIVREVGMKHHADGIAKLLNLAVALNPGKPVKAAQIEQALAQLPYLRPRRPKR